MPGIDFVTANNPAIFSFLKDKEAIPDYVLKSAKINKEEVDKLDKVAFADSFNRLYPCHTKEACWESAAYYAGSGDTNESTKEAIEKMADFHGIKEDVDKVFSVFKDEFNKAASTMEKKASIEKYALTIDFQGYQGRGEENFYPINNKAEIVTASDDCTYDYNSGRIPMEAMRKIASAITEAAVANSVNPAELTKEVRTFGTRNLPDPYAANSNLLMGERKEADAKQYDEVLNSLQEKLASTHDVTEAIAAANEAAEKIMAIDKKAGIKYSRFTPDPYSMIFTGPSLEDLEKAAASTVTIEGINVPVEDLANLSDKDITVNFSTKSAAVIKEAKEFVKNATAETCGAAKDKLNELTPDTRKVLLNVLANTGW